MKEELTASEKRVLLALGEGEVCDQRSLSEKTGVNEDAVMQTAFLLAQKRLCEVQEEKKEFCRLTAEGREYAEKGLPERRALEFLRAKKGATVEELKAAFGEQEAKIAIIWLLKKRWARFEKRGEERFLVPTEVLEGLPLGADEELLEIVAKGGEREEGGERGEGGEAERVVSAEERELVSRNLLETYSRVERKVVATEAGREVLSQGISAEEVEEEVAQLTPEHLRTGSWRTVRFKRYDVNLPSKEVFPAKVHPYQRILDRMRRIFTEMGFAEIKGEIVQSAFWNFDALFVPQDHPAREMQDTFYLGARQPTDAPEELVKNVKEMHEHGGSLNSAGWGGAWRRELGEELLLRTHTTAVTLKYLADHPEPPVKVFCIDRVYRRETIDATHIPEFDQLEGIVLDEGVTFCNLLGCLSAFYKKMGFPEVRFRPGYFPYTEPSVEVEVFVAGRSWLELGGAGIFREEVTRPLGVRHPVLAWGLGVGRLAMIQLGLTDIRDLYQPDIDWLRRARVRARV